MLDIVYEDKDKIIINKAAGQLSQSGKSFDKDIVSEVMTYRKLKRGEEPYAAIINRLDRPVSGLVLIAKNKEAAARLTEDLRKNGQKEYVAAVVGNAKKVLETEKGILSDMLIKDEKNNVSYVVNGTAPADKAKEASLEYEILSYDSEADISFIRIHLLTGRHHQIRVQLSSRNLSIVGDYKYLKGEGASEKIGVSSTEESEENSQADAVNRMDLAVKAMKLRRNQIALCAYHLRVEGKEYEVKVPFIK